MNQNIPKSVLKAVDVTLQQEDARERSIHRLACYTNMYDHVVRESLPVLGEDRAFNFACNARHNGLVGIFMGCAAGWSAVATGVSSVLSSPLASSFGMSTLALTAGTAAICKIIQTDSGNVQKEIWNAFKRRADREPSLWVMQPNQPL